MRENYVVLRVDSEEGNVDLEKPFYAEKIQQSQSLSSTVIAMAKSLKAGKGGDNMTGQTPVDLVEEAVVTSQ